MNLSELYTIESNDKISCATPEVAQFILEACARKLEPKTIYVGKKFFYRYSPCHSAQAIPVHSH